MFSLIYLIFLTWILVFLVGQIFKYKSTPYDRAKRLVEKKVQQDFQIRAHQIVINKVEIMRHTDDDLKYDALLDWRESVFSYYADYNAQVKYELEQLNVVKVNFKESL